MARARQPRLFPDEPPNEEFMSVWERYPNKDARKDAWRAWRQTRAGDHLEKIHRALDWQLCSDRWLRGFVPYLATYLRGERYNDEPVLTPAQRRAAEFEQAEFARFQAAFDPDRKWTIEGYRRYVDDRAHGRLPEQQQRSAEDI